MKRKIAIVNQRYGKDVNGGSEYYTYLLVNHLKKKYDVEVLTTTALDYTSWENYYNEGVEIVDGVRVHRFKVEEKRSKLMFRFLLRILPFKLPLLNKIFEKFWLRAQGPYCPNFIKYINKNKNKYDIFIFVTYLYYLTAEGIKEVYEKSILVPTAHDEPYIRFGLYKELFNKPRAIVFLTEEEREFALNLFKNNNIKNDVVGIGVDIPNKLDINDFKKKYGIQSEYLIYVGRVDEGKNCLEMFDYFIEYKNKTNSNLKLVIIGKIAMNVPFNEDIIYLGFVSEEEKYSGIAGAKAMIMPSKYESLSISVLESLALSVPVLVNGDSEVLKMHCKRSEAGLTYENYSEFAKGLEIILQKKELYERMRKNAINYILSNYNWKIVVEKWEKIIADV